MDRMKFVKQQFRFLKEQGYRCRSYRIDSEMELYYRKDGFSIGLFFNSCRESLDVVLEKNDKRVALLDFPFRDAATENRVRAMFAVSEFQVRTAAIAGWMRENLSELASYCCGRRLFETR